jgi:hypothetical protein
MLTPLDERTFAFLVHQGVDASLLLRLTGRAIALESDGGRRPFYRNDPQHEDEYREFRRRVLHLAALKEAGVLDVGELSYRARVLLPARADALGVPELAALLEKGFRLEREAGEDFLERSITGRLLVANYDPRELDDEERSALQRRAEAYPRNFVLVDVRPGHPGGEYPFQGWIKLRSFHAVLEFIGAGLNAAPEHDVAPAPETPAPAENPARTLEIRVDNAAGEEPLAVRFEGRRYSLAPGLWNRRGFQILHQLFQMTVSDMRASELPIAIAK